MSIHMCLNKLTILRKLYFENPKEPNEILKNPKEPYGNLVGSKGIYALWITPNIGQKLQ